MPNVLDITANLLYVRVDDLAGMQSRNFEFCIQSHALVVFTYVHKRYLGS